METANGALSVLKALRGGMDEEGRVEIDLGEVGRATGLSSDAVRQCLDDLQYEGYLRLELSCQLSEDWR